MNLIERPWFHVVLPPGVEPRWGAVCACCGRRPAVTACGVRLLAEAQVPGGRIRRAGRVAVPSCNRCRWGRVATRIALALVWGCLIVYSIGHPRQYPVAMPLAKLGWETVWEKSLIFALSWLLCFVALLAHKAALVPLDLLRRRDGSLSCSFRNYLAAWAFARDNEIQDDGTSEELRSPP